MGEGSQGIMVSRQRVEEGGEEREPVRYQEITKQDQGVPAGFIILCEGLSCIMPCSPGFATSRSELAQCWVVPGNAHGVPQRCPRSCLAGFLPPPWLDGWVAWQTLP